METNHLELPAALLKAAELDNSHLSEDAARLLAVELFREDKVSLGRAAELCQTPLAAFMEFVAKRAVAPLRYSFEDLKTNVNRLSGSVREGSRRLFAAHRSGETQRF